jgi:hypothetical protein
MALFALTISKEESRESTAFGTLPTADLIKEVKVGEAGLLRVGYSARFKSSVSAMGRAAIFLGANQVKLYTTEAKAVAASTVGTGFRALSSSNIGLSTYASGDATGVDATTGQLISLNLEGGMATLWVAPGTYDVSIQFKALEGKVVAKERRMWCETPE